MKLAFVILAAVPAIALGVRAPRPAAAPDKPVAEAPALDPSKVEPYVLKNKSSFTLLDDVRPPFWPIGMKKRAEAVVTKKVGPVVPTLREPLLKPDYFTVTGVVLGNPAIRKPSLATVNGRVFGQGDTVQVMFSGHRINVTVRAVVDGGVQLAQGDNVFFVPLKRQEVSPDSKVPTPDPTLNEPRVLDLDANAASKKIK
jgi:hypothetical protein